MKNSSTKRQPTAPRNGLSAEARAWQAKIIETFELDDEAGALLLMTAMEAFDRLREAQKILATEGIIVRDRFSQPRQHPATLVERDARTSMMRALKALNLDIMPPGNPGRPLGS